MSSLKCSTYNYDYDNVATSDYKVLKHTISEMQFPILSQIRAREKDTLTQLTNQSRSFQIRYVDYTSK